MDVNVMQSYEELFGKRFAQTSTSDECHPNKAIARIVQNPDGTRRLEPTGLADTTSPEFQRLLGPQGSLASRLGLSGIENGFGSGFGSGSGSGEDKKCFTGATGCNNDPFFHFPDLDRDSANCLYVPTFNDVPVTISMLTYLFDAFFKEVPLQEVQQTIDQEYKTTINDIVYGNIYFNYIPLTVLLLVVIWVFIIHGAINWETGVLLTVVIITVLWLSYALFDTYSRSITGDIFTRIYDEVRDNFQAKNEAIICNILKGYYTAVNHMILPEAAVCKSSRLWGPTGCGCINTGIQKTITRTVDGLKIKVPIDIAVPNPINIINRQIEIGGPNRCDGINNNNTLLPLIDKACPCISDIEGFTLAGLSEDKKEDLFDCVLEAIGFKEEVDLENLLNCSKPDTKLNDGLCALSCPIIQCTLAASNLVAVDSELEDVVIGCTKRFPP